MDNKVVITILVVLLLFGNSILPPQLIKILSNPLVKFGLIFWFINIRVKNYYHSMLITLFVALCFAIVEYLEKPTYKLDDDEKTKDED